MSGAREDAFGDPLPEGAIARLGSQRLRQPQVLSLSFSPDGSKLVSAGGRPLHVWDTETGRLVRALDPGAGTAWRVAWAADGAIAGIARDAPMMHWSKKDFRQSWRSQYFTQGTLGWVDAWAVVERGRLRAQSGSNWRIDRALDGVHDAEAAVGFGGGQVAVAALRGEVRLYTAPGGKVRRQISCGVPPTALALSATAGTMAAGFDDGRIGLWDTSTRRQVAEWRGHPFAVSALAFSPDGETLASGAGNRVRLWNAATGTERIVLPTFDEAPARLAFHPDAPRIVTRTGLLLQEWDRETGAELSSLAARGLWDDGNRLPESRFAFTGGSGAWTIWDVATGRAAHRLPLEGALLAISGDGTLAAVGGPGPVLRVVGLLPSPVERWSRTFRNATEPTFARFTPDGAWLLAGKTFEEIYPFLTKNGDPPPAGATQVFLGPIALSRDGVIASTLGNGDDVPRRIVFQGPRTRGPGFEEWWATNPLHASVRAIAFAPFRPVAAAALENGLIPAWKMQDASPLAVFVASAHDLTFGADGRRLASVCWSSGETLVWDVPA